jgi:N-acetylmuramoyl-L-alanine amidase
MRVFVSLLLVGWLSACATQTLAPKVQSSLAPSEIISVEAWRGTAADPARAVRHVPNRITLHHQGETFAPGRDVREYLRSLQDWSRNTRGWIDIPYHYIVDFEGKVYAGRNIDFAGDTNTPYDTAGHALIEVIGNYEDIEPNAAQLAAIARLMAMLAKKYNISPDTIVGHKDIAATTCPGKNLYRYLENGYFREQVAALLKQ